MTQADKWKLARRVRDHTDYANAVILPRQYDNPATRLTASRMISGAEVDVLRDALSIAAQLARAELPV